MSDPDKKHTETQSLGETSEITDPSAEPPASRPESSITQMFAAFVRQVRPEPSIAAKLTEDHITKSLEMVDSQNEREATDRKDQRAFWGKTQLRVMAGVLTLVALLVFTGNAQLIASHGEYVVIGTVGAFGGYGLGFKKGSES